MSVAFKPTRGRLLVERITKEEAQTTGGIIIPDLKVGDNKATVIKAGEGVESLEGKVISFRDDAGRTITIVGKEYLLLFENDIDGFYE